MNEKDILLWSPTYFLCSSDFKAEVNPAAFEDAHSVIKYRCTWTVSSESFGRDIQFRIENIVLFTEFYRHLSWIREPMITSDLLKHEQGHFDLAETLRSKITQKIKDDLENKWHDTRGQNDEQRKQFAREDSGAMIHKELSKWMLVLQKEQSEYDENTNFGQLKEKQTEYDSAFEQLRK